MALVGNGVRQGGGPMRMYGGTVHAAERVTWGQNLKNLHVGDAGMMQENGIPSGAEHPTAWLLSRKGGGLASFTRVGCDTGLTASIQMGRALAANIGMSSDITSAALSLVVSLAATIGHASTLSGSMKGVVQLAATIGMSGNVSAALGLIAWCSANIGMASGMTGSNLTGIAQMQATLKSYTDLTVEGMRDAVWKALAANYMDADTMGALLNAAGSGGMDPELIAKINDVWTRLALDPANPMTTSATEIAAGDVQIAITEPIAGVVVSTRQP